MNKAIQKTTDRITDFTVAQIAHEIGNPLTLIYSTVQLLSKKYPELEKDHLWNQLIHDLDYLRQLNTSLSEYHQLGILNLDMVHIEDLFKDLDAYWTSFADQNNQSLLFEISDHLPMIECDYIKIKECLINLIKNSFEASSEKSSIKVSARRRKDFIYLTVSDHGPGIPKDQIDHIFEPFTTYKSQGHGLGLSVAERIISAHHGWINVQSTPKGTHFMITLPIHQSK